MKGLTYGVRPVGWATCKWLKHFWRGCLLSRLNGLALEEMPPPALPTEKWVRCRTFLGGLCGSDLALILQRQPANSFLQSFSALPAVMGHENVAVVEETGPAADPAWRGKRVCVEPTLSCRPRGIEPPCLPCQQGQYGACENFAASGQGAARLPAGTSLGYCRPVGGSWGEHFVAHESQLVEVPAAMSDRQAVLTDPLACSLHAVLRSRVGQGGQSAGQTKGVLVYGAGIVGLGVVWGLRAAGYTGAIDVVARYAHQRQWAARLGASRVLELPASAQARFAAVAARTGARLTRARFGNFMLSGGYDLVFECVGASTTIEEALKWTRARGQAVLVSTGHGRQADLTPVWFRELEVIGAYGRSEEAFRGRKVHTYQLAHELMLAGKIDLSGLVTHTFALEDYKAALATAMHKGTSGALKVAFAFPPD